MEDNKTHYSNQVTSVLSRCTINWEIPTYYKDLDNLIGGFRAGQLSVISSASGMGKTSVCLSMILPNLEEQYNTCGFLFA